MAAVVGKVRERVGMDSTGTNFREMKEMEGGESFHFVQLLRRNLVG